MRGDVGLGVGGKGEELGGDVVGVEVGPELVEEGRPLRPHLLHLAHQLAQRRALLRCLRTLCTRLSLCFTSGPNS